MTTIGTLPTMTNDEYHADPALGSTGIRNLLKSPLTYYAKHIDPNRPAFVQTPAMKAGSLTHMLMLEPHLVHTHYVVRPDWVDGRKRDGKEWLEMNSDRECVTEEQMSVAEGQVASIMRVPELAALFTDAQKELPMFWVDPATGVHCKIKPDSVKRAGGGAVLVDLKTTGDASPEAFAKSCGNFGYHIQDAFYSEGYEAVTGLPVIGFVFVAVSNEYPYDCAPYMLDDEARACGSRLVRRALTTYADCSASGRWPGLDKTIRVLSLPSWTLKETT